MVAGPPAIASMVEQMGFRVAVCGEPPEDVVGPIRERLPTAPAAEASVLGNRELFGRLATAAMLPGLERIVAGWGPDLVVRDPCEYASAVIGHREHIAMAQVAIGLADVEWGSIEVASAALEVHRSGLTDEVRLTPYVTRFPASLDSSPFPDTRRYRETPGHPMPLPDWWDGSTAPLLYVSFGTVLGHMSMAATAYRVALAAVGELDARVLLTVGRRFDLDQLDTEPLPDEPFDWAAVPAEHRERVEKILGLVDDTCDTWFDQEHRTACRRLLARVAGEPWVINRRGKVETIAGALVWTIASFNGTTGRRRRLGVVPATWIAHHLGLASGSAFATRSIDIRIAAGIHLHRNGPEPVGEPGLIVSRKRRHAARMRDRHRAELS